MHCAGPSTCVKGIFLDFPFTKGFCHGCGLVAGVGVID